MGYTSEQRWATVNGRPSVTREIEIVRQYLDAVRKTSSLPTSKALKPYVCCLTHNMVIGNANLLFDEEGCQIDMSEIRSQIYERLYSHFDREWHAVLEKRAVECIICGKDEVIVDLSAPEQIEGQDVYYAQALYCPSCGLYLDQSHGVLARLHFGPITEERLGAEMWKKGVPR